MSNFKLTGSILANTGKKGILKPDQNGYYKTTMGALNTFNRSGEFYSASQAINLFKTSSTLIRRMNSSALYSEVGHPKMIPGMTYDQYYNRILTIEESNICGHIKSLELDLTFGQKNPNLANRDCIAVIGEVAPAGPHAIALERAFNNPDQNLAFSVRGLTYDQMGKNRVNERHLTTIVTYDYVVEPGIAIADRHTAPGLESYKERPFFIEEVMNDIVDTDMMLCALESGISRGFGLESAEAEFFEEVKEAISKTQAKVKKARKIWQL